MIPVNFLYVFLPLISTTILVVSSAPTTITVKEYGITEIKAERLTYNWTIINFHLLPQENGAKIYSPIFYTQDNEIGWKLKLYPRGKGPGLHNYVSLYLYLYSMDAPEINLTVHYTFSVFRANNLIDKQNVDYTYEALTIWGFPELVTRASLLDSAHSNITINCEIDMPPRIITKSFNYKSGGNFPDTLHRNFLHNLQNGQSNENFGQLPVIP